MLNKLILAIFTVQIALNMNIGTAGFLPGIKSKHTEQIGLIFVGSEYIHVEQYLRVLTNLQKRFDDSLWIATVDYPAAHMAGMEQSVSAALMRLADAGFSFNETTPFYFVGHSYGICLIFFNFYLVNLKRFVKIELCDNSLFRGIFNSV